MRIIVPAPAAGQRLDRYLADRGDLGSRSQVQRLIDAGAVSLNGKAVKGGASLRAADIICVEAVVPAAVASAAEPEDIPLSVLYEDQVMLVIDKPAGLVVHPAAGHWTGTLVNALLHRWGGEPADLDRMRAGIVHRLDRDTSGVMVIGRTAEVVERLSAQFRARTVEKEYVALVWRVPPQPAGVVDLPIGRDPRQRKRMAVRPGGRAAVTRWQVAEDFGDTAWLRLEPETGRTHQIRVHLAAIGHALVGDSVYGRAHTVADEPLRDFGRQALHAARLTFDHPRTGERLRFEAPLPADLGALLAHLRSRPKPLKPSRTRVR